MYASFNLGELSDEQQKRIVSRFAVGKKTDIRQTDNPLSSVWRSLQRFSGLQQARKLFPTVSDDEVKLFCGYIELADSFSAVAEDADPILDPLLLYYAGLWLSRALIAVQLGITVAASSVRTHGADPKPAAAGELTMLGGCTKVFGSGAIPELIRALGGNVPAKTTFSLVDLLRALPEMDSALQDVLNQRTSALYVFDRRSEGGYETGEAYIQMPTEVSLEEITRLPIAAALAARGAQIGTYPPHNIIWRAESSSQDEMSCLFMHTADGFYAETRLNGFYVPELAVYVLLLHALSDFSRYHPREWLDVHANHNADHTLIREFYSIAERKLPALTLNELAGRNVFYRHA